MSTIPLPALHLNPPEQQPNVLDQYARLQQIKNAQIMAPLQQQAAQQAVQEGQQNLQSRAAVNAAYKNSLVPDPQNPGQMTMDPSKLAQSLASGPAAYQTPEVMKGITDFHKSLTDAQTAAQDLQTKQADVLGNAANAIKAGGYDPQLAHSLLDQLPPSPQLQQIRQQIDNPQALHQLVDSAIQGSAKQRELGAQETTATARKTQADADAAKLAASQNPQSSLYAPTPAAVAMGTAPGAAQIQAGQVKQAAAVAGADAAARQPYQMSLQRQEQALRQGDPAAAGHLMVSGEGTLSELKARGATPEFIQQALTAAHNESGGKYNAMAADAQFDVAKSPTNTAFFGSAKSLTAPGGTLDQLAQAAKGIPSNQIPAFNSIADWTKAATGSGPLAQYASLALGVADDYSKVMGGGQGSDASRQAALNLIASKQSPEQRAASIEGIRGAVGSQINHRIGGNQVLQRMYGDGVAPEGGGQPSGGGGASAPPAGATMKVPGSDGKLHWSDGKKDLGVAQ